MTIQSTNIPAPVERPRYHYAAIIANIQNAQGGWVTIPLDDIGGMSPQLKQSRISVAARQRGLRVQTTIQNGLLYARLLDSPDIQDDTHA
jgi:hypothetical protein